MKDSIASMPKDNIKHYLDLTEYEAALILFLIDQYKFTVPYR